MRRRINQTLYDLYSYIDVVKLIKMQRLSKEMLSDAKHRRLEKPTMARHRINRTLYELYSYHEVVKLVKMQRLSKELNRQMLSDAGGS